MNYEKNKAPLHVTEKGYCTKDLVKEPCNKFTECHTCPDFKARPEEAERMKQ